MRSAQVLARTDGIVERRLYSEGTLVRAGDALFRIDQRDNVAQVQASRAALESAEATRANASAVVRRYEPLVKERAISAQEYDAARSELRQAEAQVSTARAELARSRLLLSYTIVRAPVTGRAGRASVTEGALVSASQGTLMTQVDQVSPVYAVFNISSADVLDATQAVRKGDIKVTGQSDVLVSLILENGHKYDATGRLNFTSATIDPQTGTQVVRAEFPNPDGLLKPGEFVQGRIVAGKRTIGMIVPSRAVQLKGTQASVFVLGRDGKVLSRPVTLGAMTERGWIVESGLSQGEQLIVDGWQKVRAGQKATKKTAAGSAARTGSGA